MDAVFESGFADPVLDSQTSFRAIMDALANPGTPQKLVAYHSMRHRMSGELANIVLTLGDHDTSIFLDEPLRADSAVLDFIGFHTGAPIVAEPGKASFAFFSSAATLPALDQFNLGTQEYPDRSTTVVLQVESLTGGPELISRGPGIRDHGHFAPVGLPNNFLAQWMDNRELFPRGIDLLLVADGQVMGLPRSTRLSEGH